MTKRSAGILLYRIGKSGIEVLLVHPGGPLWARKDTAAWSMPKGEYPEDENPRDAALREFQEETGLALPGTNLLELGEITQKGGKIVSAWAAEGTFDTTQLRSNTFEMQWPPKSGRIQHFPEVDRAQWCALPEAREKILPAQAELLDRLRDRLGGG